MFRKECILSDISTLHLFFQSIYSDSLLGSPLFACPFQCLRRFRTTLTLAMLYKFFSISVLSAVIFLTRISTQTSHHYRRSGAYHLGDHDSVANQRRDLTEPEIVQLQSEFSRLKGLMSAFSASAPSASAGVPSPTGPNSPLYANSTGPASVPVAGPTGTGSAGAVATFNAKASTNQAVYYGQTPLTANVTLDTVCEDPSVDIVVLAFLNEYFGPGGYPVLNLGAACGSDATTEAQAKGATGILNCFEIAGNITQCQNKGKKVMLSLGGADGTTVFASKRQAIAFATTVWNLFGGGTSDVGRPFGNVKIDGFDIGEYIESNLYVRHLN